MLRKGAFQIDLGFDAQSGLDDLGSLTQPHSIKICACREAIGCGGSAVAAIPPAFHGFVCIIFDGTTVSGPGAKGQEASARCLVSIIGAASPALQGVVGFECSAVS